MKKIYLFIGYCCMALLVSCDANQRAEGIIIDKSTGRPLDSVTFGKGEKDDGNPFHRRELSDKNGRFKFHSYGGWPSVELYFSKQGYVTVSKEFDKNVDTLHFDTIYLQQVVPAPYLFKRDSSLLIAPK